jgi:formylglycine-generating enzyme required for sulfatase activity
MATRLHAVALGAFLIPAFLAAQQAGSDPEPGAVRTDPNTSLGYAWIPPGTFQMGCVPDDSDCPTDELPRHAVTLSKGFWIGKTEVTFRAFQQFVRKTPHRMPPEPKATPFRTLSGRAGSISKGFRPGPGKKEDRPIVNVTWDEAAAFCEFSGGRLPTEAEWEYAARGGREVGIWWDLYDDEVHARCANCDFRNPNPDRPVSVERFPGHPYRLHNTSGNVKEWVQDCYVRGYSGAPADGRARGGSCSERVVRGGSYLSQMQELRASARSRLNGSVTSFEIGFRVVREN